MTISVSECRWFHLLYLWMDRSTILRGVVCRHSESVIEPTTLFITATQAVSAYSQNIKPNKIQSFCSLIACFMRAPRLLVVVSCLSFSVRLSLCFQVQIIYSFLLCKNRTLISKSTGSTHHLHNKRQVVMIYWLMTAIRRQPLYIPEHSKDNMY